MAGPPRITRSPEPRLQSIFEGKVREGRGLWLQTSGSRTLLFLQLSAEVRSRGSCKPPIRYMLYFREERKQRTPHPPWEGPVLGGLQQHHSAREAGRILWSENQRDHPAFLFRTVPSTLGAPGCDSGLREGINMDTIASERTRQSLLQDIQALMLQLMERQREREKYSCCCLLWIELHSAL